MPGRVAGARPTKAREGQPVLRSSGCPTTARRSRAPPRKARPSAARKARLPRGVVPSRLRQEPERQEPRAGSKRAPTGRPDAVLQLGAPRVAEARPKREQVRRKGVRPGPAPPTSGLHLRAAMPKRVNPRWATQPAQAAQQAQRQAGDPRLERKTPKAADPRTARSRAMRPPARQELPTSLESPVSPALDCPIPGMAARPWSAPPAWLEQAAPTSRQRLRSGSSEPPGELEELLSSCAAGEFSDKARRRAGRRPPG